LEGGKKKKEEIHTGERQRGKNQAFARWREEKRKKRLIQLNIRIQDRREGKGHVFIFKEKKKRAPPCRSTAARVGGAVNKMLQKRGKK